MRFCSRCGFPLGAVAELIAREGVPAEGAEKTGETRLSPRQKGVRQGTILVFASVVVAFVVSLLSVFVIGRPELFVSVAAGVLLLGGFLRIAYAYMFEAAAPKRDYAKGQSQLASSARENVLPPAYSGPAASFGARRFETAEMTASPSVTEPTTKLLETEQARPDSADKA